MATGINPSFYVTQDLEGYFVDKTSGDPLSGGYIYFYADIEGTPLKPVYQLSGTVPGAYTYNALNNPITLSAAGTPQDELGNNIAIYYYPYDDDGQPELYYIEAYDSGGNLQFTRHGWPNINNSGDDNTASIENFIPNGQFLPHNDHVASDLTPIYQTIGNEEFYAVAQGGWNVVRSVSGTSTFACSFEEITTTVAGLNDYPRWAFNFKCSTFNASDSVRDLRVIWPDVNTFQAQDPDALTPQPYTFTFAVDSNDGNDYTFDVYLYYYYGSGGAASSPSPVLLGSFTAENGYKYVTFTIDDMTVNGTLGTSADDYFGISIRGPGQAFDAQFTDFSLLIGAVDLPYFPITPHAETLSQSVTGWMTTPNPDGSDLYLPLILTQSGMKFDDSMIGKIVSSANNISDVISTTTNELLANGNTYKTTDYSPLGIPYARLQEKLWDSTGTIPLWGTGYSFANSYLSTSTDTDIYLVNNQAGVVTAAVTNGATSPTFTYKRMNTGAATINFNSFSSFNGFVTVQAPAGALLGDIAGGTAASTGLMTFTAYRQYDLANQYHYFGIQCVAASVFATAATGLYFDIYNASTGYRFWFNTGGETQPASGGLTRVEIDIDSTMTAKEVAFAVSSALNKFEMSRIRCVVASSIPANSYFVFYIGSTEYYGWYNIDSAGTEPTIAGATGIEIDILSTDTDSEVASKTQAALNGAYFGVPDLRGVFLRGVDGSGTWDLDYPYRFRLSPNLEDPLPGSFQFDTIYQHRHTIGNLKIPQSTAGAGSLYTITPTSTTASTVTQNSYTTDTVMTYIGNDEVRPVNAYVNFYIKY